MNTTSENLAVKDDRVDQSPEPSVTTGHASDDDELPSNVTMFPANDRKQHLRIVEALLFAASEPLDEATLADRLPEGTDVLSLLEELQTHYESRGVNLIRVAGRWGFRTSDDLSFIMEKNALEQKKLSRAALETLAIIAYHQPVTRAEIEEIRGVSTSKGTLDTLLEIGWIKMRGRRRTPGRPVTYGTTQEFLIHFGLDTVADLPGVAELKGTGLLSANLPRGFEIPHPSDNEDLEEDEAPLDEDESPLEMHQTE